MKHAHIRTFSRPLTALTTVLLTAAAIQAGPVSPPAGAVGPTMKTLAEVEARTAVNNTNTPGDPAGVYTISQSGSYYLTGNITGVSGKSGIRITADNVTLDLNGFTLTGVAGSLDGVNVVPGDFTSSVTIRNGTVRGWGGSGIFAYRNHATVEGVTAIGNTSTGISIVNVGKLTDCLARGNSGSGFYAGNDCIVSGCTSVANGIVGERDGFTVNVACVVSGCTATNNAGSGFSVSIGSRIDRCTSQDNFVGYTTYGAAAITDCAAYNNSSDGVFAGQGTTVRGCTSTNNGDDGIQAAARCAITGNTCESNSVSGSGAGIYLTGIACRVEDNHLDYNHYGIYTSAAATDNFIVKNTARGNAANFSISAGNEAAPIITNPGASTFTTMTPWSNVAF